MAANNLPNPPYVVDLAILAETYVYSKTNIEISTLEIMFENGSVHTMSRTRRDLKEEDSNIWAKHNLDRLEIQNSTRDFKENVGLLHDECKQNGIDISSTSLAPKLDIITLAKILGANVVSNDNGPSSLSMKNLCAVFNVPFYFYEDVCAAAN